MILRINCYHLSFEWCPIHLPSRGSEPCKCESDAPYCIPIAWRWLRHSFSCRFSDSLRFHWEVTSAGEFLTPVSQIDRSTAESSDCRLEEISLYRFRLRSPPHPAMSLLYNGCLRVKVSLQARHLQALRRAEHSGE
jgi:hypothetical protein